MKWFWAIVLYIIAIAFLTHPSWDVGLTEYDEETKTITVFFDPGGVYSDYDNTVSHAATLGVLVRIDGPCASACTLFMRNTHVCITPRAKFGFHAASEMRPAGKREFNRVVNHAFTKNVFYAQYPTWVQKWLDRTDALATLKVTWMEYGYARMFMETCPMELAGPLGSPR